MRKKMLLIAGLCLGSTGFAMAEGPIYNIGVGYFASFLGTPIRVWDGEFTDFGEEITSVLKSIPAGLSIFGGGGYAFGSENIISVGGEGVFGTGMSVKPLGVLHFFLQGRGFCRYAPFEVLSVAGFAGIKGSLILADPDWELPGGVYPVFGVRVEPLFFYLEYAVVLSKNFSNVYFHDIAIGFIVF